LFQDDFAYEAATQTEDHWFVSESTEESEYESEQEEVDVSKEARGQKRPASKLPRLPKVAPLKRPRVTIPPVSAVAPRTTPVVRPEEVFEKPDIEVPQKKIALKLATSIAVGEATAVEEPAGDVGSFGLIFPSKETSQTDENEKEAVPVEKKANDSDGSVITAEQLAQNRLAPKGMDFYQIRNNTYSLLKVLRHVLVPPKSLRVRLDARAFSF